MNLKVATCITLFLSIIKATPNADICLTPYCRCTYVSLVCLCRKREDITLNSFKLHEWQNKTSNILVQNCGAVTLGTNVLDFLHLNSIIFRDIDYLHIKENAFAKVPYLNCLELNDIKEMNIETRGFTGMPDIKNLTLRNVMISTLHSLSFAPRKTDEILIDNCTFGTLKENAFSVGNTKNFTMTTSRFGDLQNKAFLVHSAESVLIEFTVIESIEYHGISVLFVLNATFVECTFHNLHPNAFYVASTENFYFEKNYIEYAGPNAFDHVDVNSCVIANNALNRTEVAFLGFSHKSPPYSCTFSENEFICLNSLLWLCNFQNEYKNLIQNARCQHDATSVSSFLSENNCRYQGIRSVISTSMKIHLSKGSKNFSFESLVTLFITSICLIFLR